MLILNTIKGLLSNIHRPGRKPDIFLFSTPRSGSTFLMELLSAQPGMKMYDEPLNMRYPAVTRALGVSTWQASTTLDHRERIYAKYFGDLLNNRIPAMNRPFYRRNAPFFTNRVVMKIIHGGEDMLAWFQETFGVQILILIRHPIPTILSHAHFPRLPYFLRQPGMRRCFTDDQIAFAEQAIDGDDEFAKGIVNWCLQNRPMLPPDRDPAWTVISYEDLTMHPEASVAYLTKRLDLDPVDDLDRLINRPSVSTVQSDKETKAFFEKIADAEDRSFLITKWRDRIKPGQEAQAFDILARFDLDCYAPGAPYPTAPYRVPGLAEETAKAG